MGYIKDYEGGTLMECELVDKVTYLEIPRIISSHRWAVFQKIQDFTKGSRITYPGLPAEKFKDGPIDPREIPGVVEAGWKPDGSAEYFRLHLANSLVRPGSQPGNDRRSIGSAKRL